MSTPTSEYLSGLAIPTPPRRDGRPQRDPRLEQLAGSILAFEALSQGLMDYAGDAQDPRPLRPRSLYDLKKWSADYFPYARYRGAFPDTTIYLAFCSDRAKLPLDQAVPVPREDLWWLAASSDTLLVSDRLTHHYTAVWYVDEDEGRIHLLDPWPDRIFLKKGLNAAGVEARIEPVTSDAKHRRISITREEFLRVAVGLITRDTPELIEDYLAARSGGCKRFDVRLAFGLALMDAEQYALARFATVHLEAALRLAEAAGQAERAQDAAARLHVALVSAIHYQRWSKDDLAPKPFEDALRHLTARYGEDRLLAAAWLRELCSIGHAAGISRDHDAALHFLEVAVSRFPDEEEPYRLRAKVRMLIGDPDGALDDATRALALNAASIRALEARRDSWHPDDRFSRDDDQARIGGLQERRFDELDMRAAALIALRRLVDARAAAEELVAHAPTSSDGYAKLAGIEQLLGNDAAAANHLREAREREQSPRQRARLDALLASLQAPPAVAPKAEAPSASSEVHP
ncbi:tetratricopeptide repeat protein [Vitiosangium sp. GDMCC 1.1324]|uniref:tetratricopeptide repeat protein n=1 Tax=Vitiosangium sp. (strain GDMCC 1.1324) TaxID=2138576 RepID=UPI000D3849B6|nr:hypothetical protein [Vitiosangium sp. GDMCC 1.1324]PTL85031.1 hypothetical protein DAT35_08300 [Vitiosangium sp. GDMCC 1.1324]